MRLSDSCTDVAMRGAVAVSGVLSGFRAYKGFVFWD